VSPRRKLEKDGDNAGPEHTLGVYSFTAFVGGSSPSTLLVQNVGLTTPTFSYISSDMYSQRLSSDSTRLSHTRNRQCPSPAADSTPPIYLTAHVYLLT
jgi:hypothetical protein